MYKTRSFSRFILIIVLLSILLTACSNGSTDTPSTSTPETTAAQFDLDEYKKLVSFCVDEISDGAIALSNVVKYEYNYWKSINKLNGTFKSDKAVSSAMEWLEENSDYTETGIKSQYDSIASMYKEIISINIEGAEAEKIFEHLDELYDAYIELYNMGTSPSGDIDTFASRYNEYTDIVKSSVDKLDILLSE